VTLALLYHSARFVAVDKPPNLLMHRSAQAQDDTFLLQRVRNQIGQRVHPVHRLDRATSGVVLFALDADAARAAEREFAERRVEKTYLGICRGWLRERRVDHPLDDDAKTERREAITELKSLAQVELPIAIGRYPQQRYSLIEARPLTGRMQQIRRHLHHIFHPLIGDTTHGEGRHNRLFREHFDCHRLLLHASALKVHIDEESIAIQAPLSGEFQRVVAALPWRGCDGFNPTETVGPAAERPTAASCLR
jgi:tRNA pseudouridine65 synthase